VIAGWVRSALLAAGIDASPGSFRSAVGSSRLDSGSSLDDVLSRGNLRSCRTFFNHYYRQVQKSSSDWSIASVGSFSAVRQASQATANAVSLLVMVGFSYGIVFWADWAQLRSPINIYIVGTSKVFDLNSFSPPFYVHRGAIPHFLYSFTVRSTLPAGRKQTGLNMGQAEAIDLK